MDRARSKTLKRALHFVSLHKPNNHLFLTIMKYFTRILTYFSILAAAALVFTSCDKKEKGPHFTIKGNIANATDKNIGIYHIAEGGAKDLALLHERADVAGIGNEIRLRRAEQRRDLTLDIRHRQIFRGVVLR